MLYRKSLSLAAALLVFPALPTTGATTVSRQTIVPHSALPTPHSPLRTLLAQATDPRKEEADQFLKPYRDNLQQQQYEAAIQACQEAVENLRQRGKRYGEVRCHIKDHRQQLLLFS